MERLKYTTVVIDGIDKTGKDLIASYVFRLSGKRYLCYARGMLSMIAYNHRYGRPYQYLLENNHDTLNVLLVVNKEDWEIRCALTNEPEIDFANDMSSFIFAKSVMREAGFDIPIFNTSEQTPYQIAKLIVKTMNHLNGVEDVY